MPIKKAGFKDLRKSKKKTEKNKKIKENIKYLHKQTLKAVDASNKEKAQDGLIKSIKAIDKAIQKGVLKKNTGARKKSRLSAKVNKIENTKKGKAAS